MSSSKKTNLPSDRNLNSYFAYLRTEFASQNTYLATSRLSLAIALIAGVTKQYSIFIYAILTSVLSYVQYILVSNLLKDIMKKDISKESVERVFKVNEYNRFIFSLYSILGIFVILYEYYLFKKK
jgi:hypothetical protein